jgi:hypothetical protein
MSRNSTTDVSPADALADVLRAVADPAARHWLEALLVHGEPAEVAAGGGERGLAAVPPRQGRDRGSA